MKTNQLIQVSGAIIKEESIALITANIMDDIKNNVNCAMFDAARGAILMETKITDIIRIYSDHLDINLLKCIQNRFEQSI